MLLTTCILVILVRQYNFLFFNLILIFIELLHFFFFLPSFFFVFICFWVRQKKEKIKASNNRVTLCRLFILSVFSHTFQNIIYLYICADCSSYPCFPTHSRTSFISMFVPIVRLIRVFPHIPEYHSSLALCRVFILSVFSHKFRNWKTVHSRHSSQRQFHFEFLFWVKVLSRVPYRMSCWANTATGAEGEVPQKGLSRKHGAQCIVVQCRKRRDNRED